MCHDLHCSFLELLTGALAEGVSLWRGVQEVLNGFEKGGWPSPLEDCSLRFKSLASLFSSTRNALFFKISLRHCQTCHSAAPGCGASCRFPGEMMMKPIKPFNIKLWLNDYAPASLITQRADNSRHLFLSFFFCWLPGKYKCLSWVGIKLSLRSLSAIM